MGGIGHRAGQQSRKFNKLLRAAKPGLPNSTFGGFSAISSSMHSCEPSCPLPLTGYSKCLLQCSFYCPFSVGFGWFTRSLSRATATDSQKQSQQLITNNIDQALTQVRPAPNLYQKVIRPLGVELEPHFDRQSISRNSTSQCLSGFLQRQQCTVHFHAYLTASDV